MDKTGLLSAGTDMFYWLPLGSFCEAYQSSIGFGVKVGYGVAESFEFIGEAWYGLAQFNVQYWDPDNRDCGKTDPYLTTIQLGARFNFSPFSQFVPYAQLSGGYYTWAVYKEVGVDTNNDGVDDEYRNEVSSDENTRRFGINARLGGEFPISNDMAVDAAVRWTSIFSVKFPLKADADGGGSDEDSGTFEETVNVLTFGVGLNLYF
jgi:opacity protein-like surface antigen